jgi:hypothetical protein
VNPTKMERRLKEIMKEYKRWQEEREKQRRGKRLKEG